jgi:hypothetical protein
MRRGAWPSLLGTLLLAGLDWPAAETGPLAEPPGPAVALEVVKRRYPSHPGPANPLFARCAVRVFVDASGRPYHAEARGCAPPFVRVTEKAFASWRFEPHVIDGIAVPAKTIVSVTFLLGPRGSVTPPEPPACTYRIAVSSSRQLSRLPAQGAEAVPPCAAWLVQRVSDDVPIEGLSGTCTMKASGEDGSVDDSACPPELRPVGTDISRRSEFGRLTTLTLVIDLPGGAPPTSAPNPTE